MKYLVFLLLLLCYQPALAAPADWQPEEFEVFCGSPWDPQNSSVSHLLWLRDAQARLKGIDTGDYDRLAGNTAEFYGLLRSHGLDPDELLDKACIQPALKQEIEEHAREVMQKFAKMSFNSPYRDILPIVLGADGKPKVRLYADLRDKTVRTQYMVTLRDHDKCQGKLVPLFFNVDGVSPLYAMERYRLWAHELFHLVQSAEPAFMDACDSGDHGKWITEGSADAMSTYLFRKKYKGFLPGLARKGSKSFYGLRPYHWNLVYTDLKAKDDYGHSIIPQYRASSFFEFLSERYHGGKMDYLARYFKNKPVGGPGNYDWLKWIDQVLKKDTEVKKLTTGGLHLIFPEFLTYYATWGEKKHSPIGDKKWISESFGGCHTVQLNPTGKPQTLDVELEPLSGKCIDVKVTGLNPNDLTSLTVLTLDKNRQALENIHLGMVSTTANIIGYPFKETYNCFDAIKTSPQGSCLEKPYQGPNPLRADGRYPKIWQPHVLNSQSGNYTTRFMLIHSPVSPSDKEHANRNKNTVHLEIGLDVSQLKTSVPDAGPVKRSQGRVYNPVGASDGGLGNIPIKGGEATTPLNMLTNPEALSQMFFRMNALPGQDRLASTYQATGLSNVGLDQVDIPAEPGEDELIMQASFNIQLMPGIRFGSTGIFKGLATGTITGRNGPDAILYPWPVKHMETDALPENGRVEVIEYSKNLIHLKLDGTVCKWENLVRDAQGTVVACRKTDSFSGVIKKPFGWLYDPEQTFISTDTPSMQIYRKDLYNALGGMGMFPGIPASNAPDTSAADNGENTNTDSQLMLPAESYQCQCTCDEMKQMQAASERMDENTTAPPPELMQMMQCMGQCMSQYMHCNAD